MANDGGMTARIEAWFIEQLKSLEYDNKGVFKTVEHWRHQIGLGNSGIESFDRYAPFAFVKWQPTRPDREGGYDLNQKLTVAVAIGQTSKSKGNARIGDDDEIGISLMHSLVINLFEGKHPGEGFTCDEFYYNGEDESVDHPKKYAIEIYFEANYMKTE